MPRSSDAQGFRLRIQKLTQRIKRSAVFEMVVVGVCTVAFALNAAGIGTTLLTDDYADRKSTRLNSSHRWISYAVFCFAETHAVSTAQQAGRCAGDHAGLQGGQPDQ